MDLRTRFREWLAARRERRLQRLTAMAADLTEGSTYDLLLLHDRGFIRAKATGQSITRIQAEIESLIRKKLRVVIKPGTYFVSSGNHQNMATSTEYAFTLDPCSIRRLCVDAVCINAALAIPGEKDRFKGVRRVSDDVARFLAASKGEDPMVVQAGVWTLTDQYSRSAVKQHLISRDNQGNTWHPITDDHVDRAKTILEELGIKHSLWRSSLPYESTAKEYTNAVYVGEFRYGEEHGRGRLTWTNGDCYDGEWQNGNRHGWGVITFASGGQYNGDWQKNEKHGRGKYTFKDSGSYDGDWQSGKRHGRGVMTYADGARYDGEWQNDERQGHGAIAFANGDRYDGEWQDDKQHGRGRYTFKKSGYSFESYWHHGERQ